MNIEQIRYIVEIAKVESITKAAKNLHVSASAVSQSILQLEKNINFKLFIRLKSKTIPSEEGRVVIDLASKVLEQIEKLEQSIKIQNNSIKNELKIVCVPGITYIVTESILKFKNDYPDIDVHVQEVDPTEIVHFIKTDHPDIALLPATEQTLSQESDILYEWLCSTQLCILVGKTSPFYHYDEVTPEDLQNEQLVIYKMNSFVDFHRLIFNKNKFLFISSNSDNIRSAVKNGIAIALARNITLKNDVDVLNGSIKIIPLITKSTYISNEFWAVCLRQKQFSNSANNFITYLKTNL
ncbi:MULTISPECIES: LysR family transcriptional regulator [unclassified Bacillus (in: firmicutes)]|uniref:LysR family transcriptional regulator n=1 Tax=unclassified Bacillus (in: firmicutes) TaxID=185979 RepID=UPI0015CF7F83|nr:MULTISPECIES: LysR family transcriptional regulator [unclassified Bacillus (in: firmicutes)]